MAVGMMSTMLAEADWPTPDHAAVAEYVLLQQRAYGLTLDDAAARAARMPGWQPLALAVLERLRAEARKNRILDTPAGVNKAVLEDEIKSALWYSGPGPMDRTWMRLRGLMQKSLPAEVVATTDASSTKVVANLANPGVRGLKHRGLVLGHVQSGKTANYAAVAAKAIDSGYKLVIVLAGLHNNLRSQTQRRLDRDLGVERWTPLTDGDSDFSGSTPGQGLLANDNKVLIVVKKNPARLRRLLKWLRDVPLATREAAPVLIIDDEADQATPNSSSAIEKRTAINKLVRDIWAAVGTGSYVGYTATPFANVFMDPTDEEDLYPEDFIVELPRSGEYFGAERIFGRAQMDDADRPDPGLDMVRLIPDEDAEGLRVPTRERWDYKPTLVPSLQDALRWFILATAIRRARKQQDPSSMLIHTTHYIEPHFAMKAEVDEWLVEEREAVESGVFEQYIQLWEDEAGRVAEVATRDMPEWDEIEPRLAEVFQQCLVVVDNGASNDRLNYSSVDDEGNPIQNTVIAIGGGTLARGLTLEGLVVSYFIRTSNTYDTLLQMARWFGYRPGYEDLPRIWTTAGLRADFEFLAIVEEDLRRELRIMEEGQLTPRQVGVRIRTHPGRLAITSAAKMQHAEFVSVSYSGTRAQTVLLHEKDVEVLQANWQLLLDQTAKGTWEPIPNDRGWLRRGVAVAEIKEFLRRYRLYPTQKVLDVPLIERWLDTAAPDRLWNVAVPSKGAGNRVDVGLPGQVGLHGRAPLKQGQRPEGLADIKALLSESDWFLDVPLADRPTEDGRTALERRGSSAQAGEGLLILMPLDKNSQPSTEARRPMDAPMNLLGVGLVFPTVEAYPGQQDASYMSVRPTWTPEYSDVDIEVPDTEADMGAVS